MTTTTPDTRPIGPTYAIERDHYTTPPSLSYGDYGGGTYSRANVQWIRENIPDAAWDGCVPDVFEDDPVSSLPPVLIRSGGWGSEWVDVRNDVIDLDDEDTAREVLVAYAGEDKVEDGDAWAFLEVIRAIRATDDYPVIDEGLWSEVQSDLEDEEIDRVVSDLRYTLRDLEAFTLEEVDALEIPDDLARQVLWDLCSDSTLCFEEQGGNDVALVAGCWPRSKAGAKIREAFLDALEVSEDDLAERLNDDD